MPSCNNYRLTWVSLTPDVGYLFTAVPAKCSCCSLFWMRGISSKGIMLWSHLNLYFVVVTPNVMVRGNGAFGSFRSCNEGGTLKVGLELLYEETRELTFCPPVCHMRSQWDDSCLQARRKALTRYQFCQHLDLGFPNLWNCEKYMSVVLL